MLRRGDVRQDYLRLFTSHLAFYDKSFIISVIHIWNILHLCLTCRLTFKEFHSAAYNYFLDLETLN